MQLTYEEYLLLRLLQSDPTVTNADLAKHLQVSAHTIRRRIEVLHKKGLYNGYYAIYEPEALGLTHFFVFLYLDSVSKYFLVEKALDAHPYTVHRSRFFGPKLGIFAQFDYPSSDPKFLLDFFNHLKKFDYLSGYSLFASIGIRKRLSLDLNRITIKDLSWSYDWSMVRAFLEKDVADLVLPKKWDNVLDAIRPLDLKILRKLTFDANISQRDLSNQLGANRTTIWRRIHFLENHVISGYNAKINRRIFNLTSNKLLILSFRELPKLVQVFNVFTDPLTRPPFRYHIEIFNNEARHKELLIYITLPSYHEAQLIYTLADYADYKLYSLDVSGNHSVRYAFYDGNFDPESHHWKLDYDYVVNQPLSKIEVETTYV